ncbi:MAG: cytochrome P450 [Actinomycetota bacterium]
MTDPVRLVTHADVMSAAQDAETFSSRTSRHLHVPNGMDGEEHRAFRAIVDRQMTPAIVEAMQPMLDATAAEIVDALARGAAFDAVAELGEVFAVRAQSRWLGWSEQLETGLRDWMAENYAAAREGDPARNAAVAAAFDEIVTTQIGAHRAARKHGTAVDDATRRLLEERVDGRALTDDELVSILRNWTAGDLGSLARCVGVVVHRLAQRPRWQHRMRALAAEISDSGAPQRAEFDAILGECLRIDDPFVANKRITTCPVTTASGVTIDEGQPVLLDWVTANKDPEVFTDRFDPQTNAAHNIVFGTGPHVCPGRDLSFAELRAVVTALLLGTSAIELAPVPATRHEPPLGGWASVPVVIS